MQHRLSINVIDDLITQRKNIKTCGVILPQPLIETILPLLGNTLRS